MATNSKKSRTKTDIHVTGVEESLKSMPTASFTTPGLKALNDIIIVEEDKMTKYDGTMVIPDAYEYYAKKFPCTGIALAVGPKAKYVKVGDHIVFARLGVQRYTFEGKELCDVREKDAHAILT